MSETPQVADFLALYSRHQQRLQLYVKMFVPDQSDVDDLMQDVSIVLWQKFGDYRSGSSFYAWAKAIARNKILQHREKYARRRQILNGEAFAVTMETYDEMEEELEARRGALRRCIEKLSPTDRELIVRRYHGGTTGRDLATELGRPENSVYKSIGRIRKALMHCIRRRLAVASVQGGTA